jgi:hypothetical protein
MFRQLLIALLSFGCLDTVDGQSSGEKTVEPYYTSFDSVKIYYEGHGSFVCLWISVAKKLTTS